MYEYVDLHRDAPEQTSSHMESHMDAQLRNRNFGGQKYKPHDDPTVIEFIFRPAENPKTPKLKLKGRKKSERRKNHYTRGIARLDYERMNRYIG